MERVATTKNGGRSPKPMKVALISYGLETPTDCKPRAQPTITAAKKVAKTAKKKRCMKATQAMKAMKAIQAMKAMGAMKATKAM